MDDLRESVRAAYEIVLGRQPENDEVVDAHASAGSILAIFRNLSASPEASLRRSNSPFYFYASTFDAQDTIRRHARTDLKADPARLTNFLGVKIDRRYLPTVLGDVEGTIEPIPIPANWHADIAEWAAVLRSVDLSNDRFVIAELGCGWGCWLNNAGVAARSSGRQPFLIGVEGDEGHVEFARDCCAVNEFDRQHVIIHHGIAAARSGVALFPKQSKAGEEYGLEPIFESTEEQRLASDAFYEIPMVPLTSLIGDHAMLDLLHIDIQGGEADLIEQSVAIIKERVAYMVIGTHSRIIEGRIINALQGSDWRLEVERPAIVALTENGIVTQVDGVQGWRNLRLRP